MQLNLLDKPVIRMYVHDVTGVRPEKSSYLMTEYYPELRLICLSAAAGRSVQRLHVSKVTCWLFFYLIEIARDQGKEPVRCLPKARTY